MVWQLPINTSFQAFCTVIMQGGQLNCDLTWAMSAQTFGDTFFLRILLNEMDTLADLPNTVHLFNHERTILKTGLQKG